MAKEQRKKEEEEGVQVMVPVDVLNTVMPVSTVLVASGADLEKFNISLGHSQRSKVRHWYSIGSTALALFAYEAKDDDFPLVVHFDGKQLTQDFGGRKETLAREVLVVTSPHLDRSILVAAVPLEQETGLAVATELFNKLEDLGIKDQVVMKVADSTNVNFGINGGAVIQLQVLLQKQLLAVECVHHNEELPAKKVMEVVSERPSTSPEDKIFANIIEAWNKIMDADNDDAVYRTIDWAAHTGTGQEVAAREVLAWAKEAKKLKEYSQGDYNDCLNLILFFLGMFLHDFNIPRPGAISRTRFLQVGRMYLILFLLLDNPEIRLILTVEEVREVEVISPYVALNYLPFMMMAKDAARSLSKRIFQQNHLINSLYV